MHSVTNFCGGETAVAVPLLYVYALYAAAYSHVTSNHIEIKRTGYFTSACSGTTAEFSLISDVSVFSRASSAARLCSKSFSANTRMTV